MRKGTIGVQKEIVILERSDKSEIKQRGGTMKDCPICGEEKTVPVCRQDMNSIQKLNGEFRSVCRNCRRKIPVKIWVES